MDSSKTDEKTNNDDRSGGDKEPPRVSGEFSIRPSSFGCTYTEWDPSTGVAPAAPEPAAAVAAGIEAVECTNPAEMVPMWTSLLLMMLLLLVVAEGNTS